MNILFLEPYYGGSHKSFIDGWEKHSELTFTVLGLPPYKWRWRMRHSAVTFADQTRELLSEGASFDRIICSGMLDLASYLGLTPEVQGIPTILYMHENQLTYPVPEGVKRDSDAVFKQLTSCLAAKEIWWNSEYNMNSFLTALPKYLKRMPDYKLPGVPDLIKQKSKVMPLGISNMESGISNAESMAPQGDKIETDGEPKTLSDIQPESSTIQVGTTQPELTITWAARWEHDKNPEDFFAALSILKSNGVDFSLNVLGEKFRSYPAVFDQAQSEFAQEIQHWGYQESRRDYLKILQESDLVVSTAIHEFFGISVLEAVSAGAFPVLPKRVAYPELFENEEFFYGNSAQDLAVKLNQLALRKKETSSVWPNGKNTARAIANQYNWSTVAGKMDQELA